MKKLLSILILGLIAPGLLSAASFKIVTESGVDVTEETTVLELTKVYQPYYTAISDERTSEKTYGAVPNQAYQAPVVNQMAPYEAPYTKASEGIWVLPFVMKDMTAREKQRFLRTWGMVFRTPGMLPATNPYYGWNVGLGYYMGGSNGQNQAYLTTYSESKTSKTLWGPRMSNGILGQESTGQVTYSSK